MEPNYFPWMLGRRETDQSIRIKQDIAVQLCSLVTPDLHSFDPHTSEESLKKSLLLSLNSSGQQDSFDAALSRCIE